MGFLLKVPVAVNETWPAGEKFLCVRRCRTERHRLQLATAPASHDPERGEGQQKEEQPRSKTAHGDLSFYGAGFLNG